MRLGVAVLVALLASAGHASAQMACRWPGELPNVGGLYDVTLRGAEVIPHIDAWLRALGCDAETAPIRALLDGARLVDRRLVYSDAAVASAREDLAVHAPLCAASWGRGELLDPLVAAAECAWSGELLRFGAEWAGYAVVWSVRRRVGELALLDENGTQMRGRVADALTWALEQLSELPLTNDWHFVATRDGGMRVRLEEWTATWSRRRISAVTGRSESARSSHASGGIRTKAETRWTCWVRSRANSWSGSPSSSTSRSSGRRPAESTR